MVKKGSIEDPKTMEIFSATEFTRRQFVKSVAVVAAGAAVASLPAACKSPGAATFTAADTNPTSTEPSPATSSQTSSSSNPPATSSTAPLTSSGAIDATTYIPPTGQPPVITISGTSCTVATDRLYSADNIWVKQLTGNRVVVGITMSMFHMLNNPYRCSLSPIGTTLAQGDTFGAIEGYKLAADMIIPVSGTVVQINPLVVGIVDTADGSLVDLADPYNRGWMMVIQLSKPAELNNLLTAQQYAKIAHE